MDEVLADWVGAILERFNAVEGTSFGREDVNMWRMEDTLGPRSNYFIDMTMRDTHFYSSLRPIPGAVEGVRSLIADGHDVVIVTSVPMSAPIAFDGKVHWLREHIPEFPLANFVAAKRKSLIDADVLVDDGDHNIVDWLRHTGGCALVWDARWNRSPEVKVLELTSPGRLKRVFSWDDVVRCIRMLDQARRGT